MKTLWAIAGKMLQESFRRRSPVLLGILLAAVIWSFPFLLKSDGTLKGKLQMIITYSMTLSFLSLSLLTLFLGVASLTGEIKYKQIYLLDTKPVCRWQIFWGKFLGLAMLNGLFLVTMGLMIWLLVRFTPVYFYYQSTYKTADGGFYRRVTNFMAYAKSAENPLPKDLWVTYRTGSPYFDMERINREVDREYEERKRQNRLEPVHEAKNKEYIRSEKLQKSNSVRYQMYLKWTFRDLPHRNKSDENLKLRYRLYASGNPSEDLCRVLWLDGKGRQLFTGLVTNGEFVEFPIPVSAIDDQGNLELIFCHLDPYAGDISFPFQDGLEILYPAGNFHGDFLRGLLLLYMILCFLSLLSLFASVFLTFPVAILLAFYILVLGLIANFLGKFIPTGTELLLSDDRNIWYYISQEALRYLFLVIPDFTEYNPTTNLALGRVVEWSSLVRSALDLLIVRGGLILGSLGCIIFRSRELGKPTE